MKKYILILTDSMLRMPQRIRFDQSFDISQICHLFRENGWFPIVTHYDDPALYEMVEALSIQYAVPSQAWDVSYRSKVDSVAISLSGMGVRLIPSLESVLSYENKAISAAVARAANLPYPKTRYIVSGEEAVSVSDSWSFPFVAKSVEGFGSCGVWLINNKSDWDICVRRELSQGGLIIQELIPGLDGDWKVIVVGNIAASLWRGVRPGDFKASGSGLFEFKKAPDHILQLGLESIKKLGVPWASLDIADRDGGILIEHQVLHFGTTTCDKTPEHYRYIDGEWITVAGAVPMEHEMVDSIMSCIHACGVE